MADQSPGDSSPSAHSLRARVRVAMIEEIKATARRRMGTHGPEELSLRGVARDLDIAVSALYRYFPNRDALLTSLVVDAYRDLATRVREAEAAVARTDLRGRWFAIAQAVRDWGLANPGDYRLIYGSPITGYAAPPDTIEPASQVIVLMVEILRDAGSLLAPQGTAVLPAVLRNDLQLLIAQRHDRGPVPMELLDLALAGWCHLFALVSFEVFGRLDTMIQARAEFLDHQMALIADLAGLPAT